MVLKYNYWINFWLIYLFFIQAKEKSSTNLDLTGNQCYLVWEGIVKDYSFNKWKVVELTSEVEGKKQLAERGVDYYWDMVQNYKEEFWIFGEKKLIKY